MHSTEVVFSATIGFVNDVLGSVVRDLCLVKNDVVINRNATFSRLCKKANKHRDTPDPRLVNSLNGSGNHEKQYMMHRTLTNIGQENLTNKTNRSLRARSSTPSFASLTPLARASYRCAPTSQSTNSAVPSRLVPCFYAHFRCTKSAR